MDLSEVEIGSKLELERFDNTGERLEPTLISEFEWIEGENMAAIAAPIFEGHIVPLPINSEVNVYFIQRNGSLLSLFKFYAIITSRLVTDNLHILIVEKQGDIAKVQRRNYFRLDCFVEVQYRILDPADDEPYDRDRSYINTLANNLSGGGVCLMLEEKIPAGSIVECEMFNDQNRKVTFYGKVMRFEETGKDGKYKYEAGIAYIEISDNDREVIVRYVYDEQRKLLRKGLI